MDSSEGFKQLIEAVKHSVAAVPSVDPHVFVGYSGGLDSSLLLHAAHRAIPCERLTVVHCDHGINKDSASWARQCREQAAQLNLDFVLNELKLDANASEQSARDARYRCFENLISAKQVVEHQISKSQISKSKSAIFLLGHHADDQSETLLFRLFRGTGVKGLAGMPKSRKLGNGWLSRPFLELARAELVDIAKQLDLSWIEDDSNGRDEYDRNFIRNQLMPIIQSRWPKADKQLLHTQQLMAESDQLLSDYADQLIEGMDRRSEVFGCSFSLSALFALSELGGAQLDLVLRRILYLALGSQPSQVELDQIKIQMFQSDMDSEPKIQLSDIQLRRYRARLYLIQPATDVETDKRFRWSAEQPLIIDGLGVLSLIADDSSVKDCAEFEVRFRQGGERAKPLQRGYSQSLKKLMQEHQIEPWLRSRLPLVYQGDQLLAVADRISCSQHRFKWEWQS